MSRGPYPGRTLAGALPIAAIRGTVHMVRQARGGLYDLVIPTAVPVAFVRVMYADRILLTLAEAEECYRGVIIGLRSIISTENIPQSPQTPHQPQSTLFQPGNHTPGQIPGTDPR